MMLSLLIAIASAAQTTLPTTHIPYIRIDTTFATVPPGYFTRRFSRQDMHISGITAALDSLGYFSATADTIADTIVVHPGIRSFVWRIALVSATPYCLDSVQRISVPRPYDAGEIRGLADKTLYYFARRGYPFTRLSVDVSDTPACAGRAVSARRAGIIVTFTVSENGRYRSASPFIAGKPKTNPRLLLRDILLKPGAAFDVKMIEDSKIRLLSRPYISVVETGPPKIEPEAAGEIRRGDSVGEEAFSGSARVPFYITDNAGLGIDGAIAFQAGGTGANALTGIFTLSLLNLFHGGETGQLTYRGQQDYQRLEVGASVPYLFGVALFATTGFGLEIQQEQYGYLHGEVQLTTDLAPNWQWGMAVSAHEATRYVDSVAVASKFEGLDFVVMRDGRAYRAGQWSKEARFKMGSGLTQALGIQLTRWHIDCDAGEHMPLGMRHGIVGRIFFGSLLTDQRDTLQTVELYRTGGYKSVRGYLDNEFAFTSVAYGQAEYHYYFNYAGSIYFFTDFGAGKLNKSIDPQTSNTMQKMFGYGLGLQIPVKIGDAAIEWARNYKDTRSWGRIHISVRNSVASGLSH